MTPAQALKRIDALYAELPRMTCRGLCQQSCGPILMSDPEQERITVQIGAEPTFDKTLTCSLLVNGRCAAYAIRPMICRLWGLVKSMRCPHGCVPERWVGEEEGHKFLGRVEYLAGKIKS